jgi:mRNA interferase RelE/StbE
LRRELQGLYSARRGAYRVVSEIDERASAVVVLRVDHRSTVYRRR